jgi:transcriptional regulator with XRE-family HTH domain
MTRGETPVVRLRRLRAELRRLRDEAGHTQKSVAESLGWSTSKVIRIETGAVNISTSDLMALLHFYGINDADRTSELLAITRQKEQAWYDGLRDTYSAQFINFLAFEDSATRIRTFMGLVVPGLLQTEDYMRALFRNSVSDPHEPSMADETSVDRAARTRRRRQELLTRDHGPELSVVLDEAVIHRWVGGPEVMRDQLSYLKEMAEHPRVDLRILPFTQGTHHGMRDSFTIFEFPSEDEDYVVNIENPHRDVLIQNDPETSSKYVETFYELQDLAIPDGAMSKIVDSVIDRMRVAERN